jgi:hypothetical protein
MEWWSNGVMNKRRQNRSPSNTPVLQLFNTPVLQEPEEEIALT